MEAHTIEHAYTGNDGKPELLVFEKPTFTLCNRVQAMFKHRYAKYRNTELNKLLEERLEQLKEQWSESLDKYKSKEEWLEAKPETVKGDDYWACVAEAPEADTILEHELEVCALEETIDQLVAWHVDGKQVEIEVPELRQQFKDNHSASLQRVLMQARAKVFGLGRS